MTNIERNVKEFKKIFNDYIELKTYEAVTDERIEVGYDLNMGELEYHCEVLKKIADEYEIRYWNISDDYDVDELNEYVIYLEKTILEKLYNKIVYMFLYG